MGLEPSCFGDCKSLISTDWPYEYYHILGIRGKESLKTFEINQFLVCHGIIRSRNSFQFLQTVSAFKVKKVSNTETWCFLESRSLLICSLPFGSHSVPHGLIRPLLGDPVTIWKVASSIPLLTNPIIGKQNYPHPPSIK